MSLQPISQHLIAVISRGQARICFSDSLHLFLGHSELLTFVRPSRLRVVPPCALSRLCPLVQGRVELRISTILVVPLNVLCFCRLLLSRFPGKHTTRMQPEGNPQGRSDLPCSEVLMVLCGRQYLAESKPLMELHSQSRSESCDALCTVRLLRRSASASVTQM